MPETRDPRRCSTRSCLGQNRGLKQRHPPRLRLLVETLSCVGTVPEFLGLLCGLHKRTYKTKALLEIKCKCLLLALAVLFIGQTHYQMPVNVYANFKILKVERCDTLSKTSCCPTLPGYRSPMVSASTFIGEAFSASSVCRPPSKLREQQEPRAELYPGARHPPHISGGILPRCCPPKPLSHARMVPRCFGKEIVLAGFAAEAQAPMVVVDKTKLPPTMCTAFLQLSHKALH